MVANIVNLLSKALTTRTVQKNTSVSRVVPGSNPFANPFVAPATTDSFLTYAKNKPVRGGYFAGYHNGKANIVGQRLFIEV